MIRKIVLAVLIGSVTAPGSAPAQEPKLPPKPKWTAALQAITPPSREDQGARDAIAALFLDQAENEESARRMGARNTAALMRDAMLAAGIDPDVVNRIYEDIVP